MRLRIHFQKTNAMRYTGHLDLHKAWERAMRRAKLPLAYSQGFHPQPKINLACALPLGFTSDCELVDIILENEFVLDEIESRLDLALPPGIKIVDIKSIDDHAKSLQPQVQSAEYQLTMLTECPDLQKRINDLCATKEIQRIRRGKSYDLRPLIEQIQILPKDDKGYTRLKVRLAAREGATGRPEELIAALGYNPLDTRYHRTDLIIAG